MRIVRDGHPRDLGLSAWLPAFLLGFMAASFQIYLLREFAAEFTGNELLFGFVLGSWLLWGGIGSLVRPRPRPDGGASRLAAVYGAAVVLFAGGLVVLRFSSKLLKVLPAETTGLLPALGFSLFLAFLLSFPLGHAFVLNAGLLGGDVPRVYLLESAGAAAAGLAVHFLLIPRLPNWRGAAIVGGVAAALTFVALKPGRARSLLALALVASGGLAVADRPALRAAWKPLGLVDAADTPYGKLTVVRTAEQVTLYDNGLVVFTRPDVGAAEDAVHFALLQRDDAIDRVLLIGGTAGGCVEEILKYPGVRVTCVELDPAVILLARKHLPAAALAALDDPRVRIVTSDGRAFLERTSERYDAILLSLPDPATIQVNRYYTREFFAEVREKLEPGGILSFVLPGAENYVGGTFARLLASVIRTLIDVFDLGYRVIPGSTVVVLASAGPLTLEPEVLSARIERLGLATTYVSPAMLPFRLDPGRVSQLTTALTVAGAEERINRDLVPVSCFYQSVLWADQFGGAGSRLLRAATRTNAFWLLDLPLALTALALVLLAWLLKRSSRSLVPIAAMGFTTIVVEVAVLIAFQANFGYVYGKIPLLLAAFMAGLVLGAALGRRRKRPGRADLPLVQAGFVLLLLAAYAALPGAGGEVAPFLLLAGFGLLGGFLFIAANRLVLRETPHAGLAYGVDLIASFAGAALTSALLIPLFGIPALVLRLVVLNALVFLYTLVTSSR